MAIRPEFEHEDAWDDFLAKTDPRKRVEKVFKSYTWSFGRDEDDEGFTRECVILEVACSHETETKQVQAKLTPKHLKLSVQGKEVIDDDFTDETWLDVQDSYWELEGKKDKAGQKIKNLRYLLYVRSDCPKYITGALFHRETLEQPGDKEDEDDDNVDKRIREIANVKEPEPRRDDDVWFSEEEDFSEPECAACGSKNVQVMKKAEDREFKVYCSDCGHASKADLHKEAPSIRRQREIDEARARKKEEKERKQLEKEAQEKRVIDLVQLQEVD
jgi:hypothetical protein